MRDIDIDTAWTTLRNAVVRMFREDGIEPPDAEEIAICADRGYTTAEAIYNEILRQRE